MDKYEFNIKVEQIKKMVSKSDYETAMKIADTIDWRRVRNVNILSMVATIYEKNEEYQEAKDILLLAFERAPIGKRLLFKLAELAIKEGSLREAEDYYREFCDLAPDDPRQYILRYMILGAKGAPAEQLIHTLEQYCNIELDEKWLYELAELYAEAGMGELCIMACDKIMLMFGLGKYVEKAMELKIQFAPLTKYQMDLVENRDKYEAKLRAVENEYRAGKPRESLDGAAAGRPHHENGAGPSSRYAGDQEAALTSEPGYGVEEDYGDVSPYSRELVYTREPGYEDEPMYEDEAGYEPEGAYGRGTGYEAEDGYDRGTGYGAEDGYDRGTGYGAEDGYDHGTGYEAEGAYDRGTGYEAEDEYDHGIGYEAESIYNHGNEYEAEGGYTQDDCYEAEAGYARESGYETDEYLHDDESYGPEDPEYPLHDPVHTQVTIEPEDGAKPAQQEWKLEETVDTMTDEALKARMHEAEVQANLAMEMSRISDKGYKKEVEMAQTRVLSDIRDIKKGTVRQAHHLMIEAESQQQGLELAIETLKKIHKETGARNQAAKITGEKMNSKGVFNLSDKLTGKDLIIESAADMTETILQELNQLMARDETGMNVVLIDTAERLAELHRIYPGLAKRFEYIGTSMPSAEDKYEAPKEDSRPVRQIQVKKTEKQEPKHQEPKQEPQPTVRTLDRKRPVREEIEQPVHGRPAHVSSNPAPSAQETAANEAPANEVPAYETPAYEPPVHEPPAPAPKERKPVPAQKSRPVPSPAIKKVPEPVVAEEEEIPDDEEMDIDEFAKYACEYASDIDCSISGKSMLALYERIEIMEEDGIPLTRVNAEDLIEEAADRAENPSFFKRITGIFSSKYDKDGLLILKEEHFI